MKRRLGLALVGVLVIGGILAAPYTSQAQQSPDSYQSMSDKFFVMLQQGKTSEAVDFLMSTNPAMRKVPDDVEQLKTQFGSLGKL
jgi:hypothetical protein